MEQKKSFYRYMKQHYSCKEFRNFFRYERDLHLCFADSPFGDLTADMMRDTDFPKTTVSYTEIRKHISRKFAEHCGYHSEYGFPVYVSNVLDTLKEAFREYYSTSGI